MNAIAYAQSQLSRIKELTNNICDEECNIVAFFQACPDILCIIDRTGLLSQTNDAWERLLGWTEQDLTNHSWTEFVHAEDVTETERIVASLKKSQVIRFYVRFKIKSCGGYMPLEWTAVLGPDDSIYGSAREIPEQCLECNRARLMKST